VPGLIERTQAGGKVTAWADPSRISFRIVTGKSSCDFTCDILVMPVISSVISLRFTHRGVPPQGGAVRKVV